MLKAKVNFSNNLQGNCKICGCRIEDRYEYCGEHFQQSHKIMQPAGKRPYFNKSKAERRKWWFGLSDQQKADYIAKKQNRKSQSRRIEQLDINNLEYMKTIGYA